MAAPVGPAVHLTNSGRRRHLNIDTTSLLLKIQCTRTVECTHLQRHAEKLSMQILALAVGLIPTYM